MAKIRYFLFAGLFFACLSVSGASKSDKLRKAAIGVLAIVAAPVSVFGAEKVQARLDNYKAERERKRLQAVTLPASLRFGEYSSPR